MTEAYLSLFKRERYSGGDKFGVGARKAVHGYGFTEYDLHAYKRLRTSKVISHVGCINTIRWSSTDNGRYMVTGSDDTIVKVWDCKDYKNEVKLSANVETGHQRNIFCAELSHTNNKVVSCAADGTVRVNNVDGSGVTGSLSSGEEILASSLSMVHMFKFDVCNPNIIYVCEDRGTLLRIDMRSVNENRVIYSARKRWPDDRVKACAQSASFGSQYIFVGGAGFVLSQLDTRRIESNGARPEEFERAMDYDEDDEDDDESLSSSGIREGLRSGDSRQCSRAIVAKFSPHGLSRSGRSAVRFKVANKVFMADTGSNSIHYESENWLKKLSGVSDREAFERTRAEYIRDGRLVWSTDSFKNSEKHVSVSGLEISRDGSTLLASYQGDQVYTFPLNQGLSMLSQEQDRNLGLEGSHSSQDLDLEEDLRVQSLWSPYWTQTDKPITWDQEESCPYVGAEQIFGGHINFATFLKQVSFYGPNDEYILTGSDSGHIYIFDRKRGGHLAPLHEPSSRRVTRLLNVLKADNRTVNGVIAHPSLPLFASYGIDSDAKLWTQCDRDYDEEERREEDHVIGSVSSTSASISDGDSSDVDDNDEIDADEIIESILLPARIKRVKKYRPQICSVHCELAMQWGRLDLKRVHYGADASIYHQTGLVWNEGHALLAMGEAYARDRRLFDQMAFHDSSHGILRDLSLRGIVACGVKDVQEFISQRYPGRDPLPGPAKEYNLSITKPFDLILELEQRDSLLDTNSDFYLHRTIPLLLPVSGTNASASEIANPHYSPKSVTASEPSARIADGDGATLTSICKLVMDPRCIPPDIYKTFWNTISDAVIFSREGQKLVSRILNGPDQEFFSSDNVDKEVRRDDLCPSGKELMALFGTAFMRILFISQKLLEASEIMKKNGSLALKAGEAKLALVFYHRAGDFTEYTTENITGSLDKDDKSAFALHDAKVGGFTDHIWRTTYFPSETEEKALRKPVKRGKAIDGNMTRPVVGGIDSDENDSKAGGNCTKSNNDKKLARDMPETYSDEYTDSLFLHLAVLRGTLTSHDALRMKGKNNETKAHSEGSEKEKSIRVGKSQKRCKKSKGAVRDSSSEALESLEECRVREEQQAMIVDDDSCIVGSTKNDAQPSTPVPPHDADTSAGANALDASGSDTNSNSVKSAKFVFYDSAGGMTVSTPCPQECTTHNKETEKCSGKLSKDVVKETVDVFGLSAGETAIMDERNRLMHRVEVTQSWKRRIIYQVMMQAHLLRFQALNNIVQALVTLQRHSQVVLLGSNLAAFGKSILGKAQANISKLDKGDNEESHLFQAQEALKGGRAVVDTWRKGLVKLFFRVGCSELQLKRWYDAKDTFAKAAELDPSDSLVLKKLRVAKDHCKHVEQRQMKRLANAFGGQGGTRDASADSADS